MTLMRTELPTFRRVKKTYAATVIHGVLSGPRGSALLELIEYDDHHYRAIFAASYFQMALGKDIPSKSQWNTLKKKLKRRNRSIFVFREHGQIDCASVGAAQPERICLFLDFGFLLQ